MSGDARPRVLCVDDDPQLLKSLRWLLARDHDVVLAEGADEGLRAIASSHFDVIVSDQRMPGMSGTEFLKRARALSPRSVRLLLTGYADFPSVLSSVNDCEVFRFISKPWDSPSLLAVMAEAVRAARAGGHPAPAGGLTTVDLDIDATRETVMVFDRDLGVAAQVELALHGTRHMQWCNGIGQAVRTLSTGQVAVLVTDIGDGDLQQMDLIRALRHHQPQVVVVVHSRLRDSATLGRLINEVKIHRYLTKPAAPDYLRRTLQSALARHRHIMGLPETAMRRAMQLSSGSTFEQTFANASRRPARDAQAETAQAGTTGGASRSWLQRLFD